MTKEQRALEAVQLALVQLEPLASAPGFGEDTATAVRALRKIEERMAR